MAVRDPLTGAMIFETFLVQRAMVVHLTVWLAHGLMARAVRVTVFVCFASDGD